MQLVQRAIHRTRAGEGPEIAAFRAALAAVLADLGIGVIFCNQDVRKAFVVAQQHIVDWLELLDQILFQQQRLGFGARGQEHHRPCFRDHPRDARRMP